MSSRDEAALRAANDAWYEALRAMLHGDPRTAVVRDANSVAVEALTRESSVHRRENGAWKMIAHHAVTLPTWIEVAGAAREV